ncbi:MAG: LacI family DNA-binding transcriptional regulator [Hyphomicrobiales bacterium]
MSEDNNKRARPSQRVRLQDLAAQCGVSISTASRAVAGEKGVRPEVRTRLLAAARALNYAIPSSLAGRRVIVAASEAAMIDYVRNQFTVTLLQGLQQRAQVLGLEIATRSVATRADEAAVLEEGRSEDSVVGLIFLTLDDEEMLEPVRRFPKPVVLLNGDDPSMLLSSVAPNNRPAGRLAADHLVGLGHERILFLMRCRRRTIQRRYEGWRDSLVAHAIAPAHDLVLAVDDWTPQLAAAAVRERIESRGLDFTAILAAGDALAIGAMLGIQQSGFSVPRDVSVVGMDDLPQSAFLNPPLTTVHLPTREMGAVALDLLRDELSGVELPARRVELACHLVERRSTAQRPG